MLAVVEQHHHSPAGELLHNGRRSGPDAGQRKAERCRGGRRYQPPNTVRTREGSSVPRSRLTASFSGHTPPAANKDGEHEAIGVLEHADAVFSGLADIQTPRASAA